MPTIIELPTRSNAIEFDSDTVREVAVLLLDVAPGSGVGLDDSQDSENKARARGKRMADLIAQRYDVEKPRVHVITGGTNANPNYTPALSIKADGHDPLDAAITAEDEAEDEADTGEDAPDDDE